jgi:hypothetical protein
MVNRGKRVVLKQIFFGYTDVKGNGEVLRGGDGRGLGAWLQPERGAIDLPFRCYNHTPSRGIKLFSENLFIEKVVQ